jgi:Mg/Co/Ni transporter MgtE
LGFHEVYDYADGKVDWMAAALPTEGAMAPHPRAGSVARRDAPTCGLDEPIEAVRQRAQAVGWDACVVVNEERIVLGFLRGEELASGSGERIESIMRPGPSTFRPHVPIEEMARFMIEHDLPTSPITTSDGRLIGVLRREDAIAAAREHAGHVESKEGGS